MIYLDFETRGVVDLIKCGALRYATDLWTQVNCFCWSYDDEEFIDLWHRDHPWIDASPFPTELCERIADGEPVEAHNAGFEFDIWNNALPAEFPEFREFPLSLEQLHCSAAKASCVSLPRALDQALKAIGAPPEFQKDTDGKRLIKKLAKPLPRNRKRTGIEFCEEEDEHRRNWKYCAQDIRAERYLSKWCPEMTPREREYWLMDQRMNLRGVRLDIAAAKRGLELADEETKRLDAEMQEITEGRVPGGKKRKKFREWANTQGLLYLEDTKADTLSFALHGVPTKAGDALRDARKEEMDDKWADAALFGPADDLRRTMEICMEVNKTSTSKYTRMLSSVCDDDRLHDIMLYNGADRTGRWSGKGVQPHNFVRGYSKDMVDVWRDIMTCERDDIEIIWGDPLPCLAKACRGALVASPGKLLYAADFSAIEAIKLSWMTNCKPMLDLFTRKKIDPKDPNNDPYLVMAMAIYERELTKADSDERQLGKRAVLGLGYEMGAEKFQATVWKEEGIWLDLEFCKKVVRVYRKDQCPEVPVFWRAAEEAAIKAVTDGGEWCAGGDELGQGQISYFMSDDEHFLHCRLPSGRLLAYMKPEVHTKIMWRFHALNDHGERCFVTFPSKKDAPLHRARWHAEKMAETARKTLLPEAPETFLSPHLSFMGRDQLRKQWRRIGTYGGSLTENADQASSRDLLAEAMYRVDQTGVFDLLLSIHDEVIAEAPPGAATVAEFEALMSEVPKWAAGMPITAEGWIGPRLRK